MTTLETKRGTWRRSQWKRRRNRRKGNKRSPGQQDVISQTLDTFVPSCRKYLSHVYFHVLPFRLRLFHPSTFLPSFLLSSRLAVPSTTIPASFLLPYCSSVPLLIYLPYFPCLRCELFLLCVFFFLRVFLDVMTTCVLIYIFNLNIFASHQPYIKVSSHIKRILSLISCW